ncbi:MAG TPA: hypothetical protein VMU11_02530 [Verrucomicrobiae bacterium]|nr:hypothetical protein [Verrucomicrobiae bacterium]
MKKHQKLVRDKVVDRILAKGEHCTHHVAANDAERRDRLGFKILEEIEEFGRNNSHEELIDVQEIVLHAERFGRHARPSDEAVAEWIGTMPAADEQEDALTASVYSLIEAATEYAARPSDNTFRGLVIALEIVIKHTGFERDTLEAMRRHKLETHGGFEKWIILDEA